VPWPDADVAALSSLLAILTNNLNTMPTYPGWTTWTTAKVDNGPRTTGQGHGIIVRFDGFGQWRLSRKSPEDHGYNVSSRCTSFRPVCLCRRRDLEQFVNNFGRDGLVFKLGPLPWIPFASRHDAPFVFSDGVDWMVTL